MGYSALVHIGPRERWIVHKNESSGGMICFKRWVKPTHIYWIDIEYDTWWLIWLMLWNWYDCDYGIDTIVNMMIENVECHMNDEMSLGQCEIYETWSKW